MRLQKKIMATTLLSTFLFQSVGALGENPIEIQYIKKLPGYNDIYNVYLKNSPTSLSDLKITLNDLEDKTIKPTLHKEYLELANVGKSGGKIAIEKFNTTYKDGGLVSTSDSKTQSVEIRKIDDTYFLGTSTTESALGKTAYILYLSKEIDSKSLENKKYELDINGQIAPLEYYKGTYEEGKYYIVKNQIKFFQTNLTKEISHLTLKIDGLKSNSITINKMTLSLPKVKSIEVSQGISTKEVRIHIQKDPNITKGENFDVYINNVLFDKNLVTFTDNEIILKYDISKKVEDVLVVQVKNKNDGMVSNKLPVSLTQFSVPNITKLDFGEDYREKTYFDFKVIGDGGFFGEAQNLEVNLNGTGYTTQGVKQVIKNKDGSNAKDINGNDQYETVQKIDIKKDKNQFYFSFYTKDIQENNVFYFTNKTYDKTSNRVFFSKDFKKINYNYLTGEILKPETVTYTKSSDQEKNIDFFQKPEKDFSFGKITFNNLKPERFYKLSFTLSSDNATNPFQEIKFGDDILGMVHTNSGTLYTFEKMALGKEFSEKEILFNLNELFNLNKTLHLKWSPITLEILNKEGNFEPSYQEKLNTNISFLYNYHISDCFDGVGDYCDALKLGGDSYLDFVLQFAGEGSSDLAQKPSSEKTSSSNIDSSAQTEVIPVSNPQKIAAKAKFSKQMILAKNKLSKSMATKKYISQIDTIVQAVSVKKGNMVLSKIAQINKEKLGTKKEIFEYLEAKIWLKINN